MNKIIPAPKTKTFFITLGGIVLLAALLIIGTAVGGVRALSSETVASPEARVDFLHGCGWEVDITSEETQEIHIPETFNAVYESYNDLQKQQGYDLEPYQNQDCVMYTYSVTNYPDKSQTVLANLYVYKNRIIGGDVHSTNLNGFMVGLK